MIIKINDLIHEGIN